MPRHLQKESSQRTSVRARSSSSTGRRTSRPEFPSKSGFSHPPRRLPSAGTPWCSASSIPKWVVWCFIHSLVIMSSFVRLDHAWFKTSFIIHLYLCCILRAIDCRSVDWRSWLIWLKTMESIRRREFLAGDREAEIENLNLSGRRAEVNNLISTKYNQSIKFIRSSSKLTFNRNDEITTTKLTRIVN